MAKSESIRIDTKTGRGKLAPRSSPYWHKLAVRKHLGCRKLGDGSCRWIARLTTPDRKYHFQALGDDAEMDFDAASDAARVWFGDTDPKVKEGAKLKYTLRQAVDDYAAHLKTENSERASREAKGRLLKHLPEELLKKPVANLTTKQLKDWRDGMVKDDPDADVVRRSKDTANRLMNSFKAALNLAWRSGLVADDSAWRRLTGFKKVTEARVLFLTEEQAARLVEHAADDLSLLIRAGILTGARLGELAETRVHDFSEADGSLFIRDGKTGARTTYLADSTVEFFAGQAADKEPEEFIFAREDGKPWNSDDIRRPFKDAVSAAELPPETTFYSLRHYHISRALLAGVQPQVVAENCGTSLRMIEKHYGKFLKTDRRAMFNEVAL